jgi:hypothetical protein
MRARYVPARAAPFVLATSLIALAAGCGRRLAFDHLNRADRIEVRANAQVLRVIEDQTTIAQARQFIAGRADGWRQNVAGTPIPVFVVYFYAGEQSLGGYGVGADFLTSDPGGGLLTRPVSPSECAKVAASLGVSLEGR